MAPRSTGSIKIKRFEQYREDDWWSWSVWLEGPLSELNKIDYVEYTLHPTFANPVRRVSSRSNRFRLDSEGWGVFPIYLQVVRKDGKVKHLKHQLKLHYPNGKLNFA
jgi:transcription initiation factor IIF auxiliary subunit